MFALLKVATKLANLHFRCDGTHFDNIFSCNSVSSTNPCKSVSHSNIHTYFYVVLWTLIDLVIFFFTFDTFIPAALQLSNAACHLLPAAAVAPGPTETLSGMMLCIFYRVFFKVSLFFERLSHKPKLWKLFVVAELHVPKFRWILMDFKDLKSDKAESCKMYCSGSRVKWGY